MAWEMPSYIEVNMSSEIGAYQDDFEERIPVSNRVASRSAEVRPVGPVSGSEN